MNVIGVAQSELVDILARGYVHYRRWARRVPKVPAEKDSPAAELPSDSVETASFSSSEKQLDWGPSPKHSWSQELTNGDEEVEVNE